MPPKNKKGELPQSFKQIKDMYGSDVTKEMLATAPANLMKAAYSALNTVLKSDHPALATQFDKAGRGQKRHFVAAFLPSPTDGGASIINKMIRVSEEVDRKKEFWLTDFR